MKKPLLFGIFLTVCVIIVAFVFAQFYPEGMISYWKFEEGSGPTASDSVDTNDGTLFNEPVWTTGQVGGALSFDGVNDYVDCGNDASLGINDKITLEVWMYPTGLTSTSEGIVGFYETPSQDGYEIGFNFAGEGPYIRFYVDFANFLRSPTQLPLNTWTHVVGTYDGSNLKVYLNGYLDSSILYSGGITPKLAESSLTIGRWYGDYHGYYFKGLIDEVAIYDRALPVEEIQHHYQDGLHGLGYDVECVTPPPGLVSWWPGDGDAKDIVDGNNGTEHGATYAVGRVGQAFSFDGVDDYVSLGTTQIIGDDTSFTIDAWIKVNSFAPHNMQLPIYGEFNSGTIDVKNYLAVGNTQSGLQQRVFFDQYIRTGGYLRSNIQLTPGRWYHVAYTQDGTTRCLYIDGTLDNSDSVIETYFGLTPDDARIGRRGGTGNYMGFDGLIDELEIYNCALSQSEIQAIYNAGSMGKCKVEPNQPPVANAGSNQMFNCINPTGTLVTLDGSGSNDPDGDPLTYAWTGPFLEGGGTVTDVYPMVTLSLGTSTITLVVNDGQVDSEADTVDITITVGVDGFLPPLASLVPEGEVAPLPRKASKQGRTLPLKLQLSCGTTVLSDTDVDSPEIVSLEKINNASDLETIDMDSGEANDSGLLFRFSEPIWVYNLSTRDLSIGTYVITIKMPDGRLFRGTFVLR